MEPGGKKGTAGSQVVNHTAAGQAPAPGDSLGAISDPVKISSTVKHETGQQLSGQASSLSLREKEYTR